MYTREEQTAVHVLLRQYGDDSLSYFSLQNNRKYFFSSSGKSFISYRKIRSIALVSADPVGPAEEFPSLIQDFLYFTKGAGLQACFLGLRSHHVALFRRFGFNVVKIGEEAVVDVQGFDKALLKKKVRRAERHVLTKGVHAEIYTRAELPISYIRQMREISREWIKRKGGKERGFSMTLGRFPKISDTDYRFILAIEGSTVLGFIGMVPVYKSNGWSVDIMRYKEDSPNGLMEFLVLQVLQSFKKSGAKKMSLNFATFSNSLQEENTHLKKKLLFYLYKPLFRFFKCHSLFSFNEKFLPEWQSRYVAFQGARFVPRLLFAVISAELFS